MVRRAEGVAVLILYGLIFALVFVATFAALTLTGWPAR